MSKIAHLLFLFQLLLSLCLQYFIVDLAESPSIELVATSPKRFTGLQRRNAFRLPFNPRLPLNQVHGYSGRYSQVGIEWVHGPSAPRELPWTLCG